MSATLGDRAEIRAVLFIPGADGASVAKALGMFVGMAKLRLGKAQKEVADALELSGDGSARSTDSLSGVLTALTSPATDPAADAQFRDQVEHLCEHLDDSERRILDLRLEGFTPSEIADQLGVSRVALRVRLTRLRQRLQATGVVTDWL